MFTRFLSNPTFCSSARQPIDEELRALGINEYCNQAINEEIEQKMQFRKKFTGSYNTVFKQHVIIEKGNLEQIAQDFHRSCSILHLNGNPCRSLNYEIVTPGNIIELLETRLFQGVASQLRALLIDYSILYLHQGGLLHSLQATIIGRLIQYDYNFPSLVSIAKKAIHISYDEIKNQLSIREEISGKIKSSVTHMAEESRNLVPHPFPLGANLFTAIRNQTIQFTLDYNISLPILNNKEAEIDTIITYYHPKIQAILDERNAFEKEIDNTIQKWCKENAIKTSPHAASEFISLSISSNTEKKYEIYLLLNQTLQFIKTLRTIENNPLFESPEQNLHVLLAYLQYQYLQEGLKKLILDDTLYQKWIDKHLLRNYSKKIKMLIETEYNQRFINKMHIRLESKYTREFEHYLTKLTVYAADPEIRNLIGKLQIEFFIFIALTTTASTTIKNSTLQATLYETYMQFHFAISQAIKEYISASNYSFIQEKLIVILRHLLNYLPFFASHFIQNKILGPKANTKGTLFKMCQAQEALNTIQPIAHAMILIDARI